MTAVRDFDQTRHAAVRPLVQRCHVLREDPDLGARLPADQRAIAVEQCVAAMATLPAGRWDPALNKASSGIGLLVLDGLMLRRVGIDGRYSGELLGPGDVLRPWQESGDPFSLVASTTEWRLLEPTRVAVLEGRATAQIVRFPALISAVAERALARARSLSVILAIAHQPRTEARVHMLLWHLADRWGRVRKDGIYLPLRLSHGIVGDLIAAQRPSVTVALRSLGQRGLVARVDEGWLLRGDPPGELLELQGAAAMAG